MPDTYLQLGEDDRKRVLSGDFPEAEIINAFVAADRSMMQHREDYAKGRREFDKLFKTDGGVNDYLREAMDRADKESKDDRFAASRLMTFTRRKLYLEAKNAFDRIKQSVPNLPFKLPEFKKGRQLLTNSQKHKLRSVVESVKGGHPMTMVVIQELLSALGTPIANFEQIRQDLIDQSVGIRDLHQKAAIKKFRMKKVKEASAAKSKEFGSRLLQVRGPKRRKPDNPPDKDKPASGIEIPKSFSSVFR